MIGHTVNPFTMLDKRVPILVSPSLDISSLPEALEEILYVNGKFSIAVRFFTSFLWPEKAITEVIIPDHNPIIIKNRAQRGGISPSCPKEVAVSVHSFRCRRMKRRYSPCSHLIINSLFCPIIIMQRKIRNSYKRVASRTALTWMPERGLVPWSKHRIYYSRKTFSASTHSLPFEYP